MNEDLVFVRVCVSELTVADFGCTPLVSSIDSEVCKLYDHFMIHQTLVGSMSRYIIMMCIITSHLCLQGCVLTKAVTVPVRTVGAVSSVVPIIGRPIDKTLDLTADIIDDIPS